MRLFEQAQQRSEVARAAMEAILAEFPSDLMDKAGVQRRVVALKDVPRVGVSEGATYDVLDRFWEDGKGWAVILGGKCPKNPQYANVSIVLLLPDFLEYVESGFLHPVKG